MANYWKRVKNQFKKLLGEGKNQFKDIIDLAIPQFW